MAQFPKLKTGAIAQYPLKTSLKWRTDIVSFLDGAEQRFRNSPSVIHEWRVALSGLDEQEMASVESFFLANQGAAATFSFTDPGTAVTYSNCSLAQDEMQQTYLEALSSQTILVIRENRT